MDRSVGRFNHWLALRSAIYLVVWDENGNSWKNHQLELHRRSRADACAMPVNPHGALRRSP